MNADEILKELELTQGSASKSYIRLAYRLADDGGTIAPEDAMRIFGRSDPQMAKHMSLLECLRLLGCRPE